MLRMSRRLLDPCAAADQSLCPPRSSARPTVPSGAWWVAPTVTSEPPCPAAPAPSSAEPTPPACAARPPESCAGASPSSPSTGRGGPHGPPSPRTATRSFGPLAAAGAWRTRLQSMMRLLPPPGMRVGFGTRSAGCRRGGLVALCLRVCAFLCSRGDRHSALFCSRGERHNALFCSRPGLTPLSSWSASELSALRLGPPDLSR
mmetsp:Transcript_50186/g.107549  ORF Transcript_50186/g.107549 Transcript_50186/m.107549 type:complete len:203 (-) Transcript_50186:97-705(-)